MHGLDDKTVGYRNQNSEARFSSVAAMQHSYWKLNQVCNKTASNRIALNQQDLTYFKAPFQVTAKMDAFNNTSLKHAVNTYNQVHSPKTRMDTSDWQRSQRRTQNYKV